jgi:hypothetical protein
MYSTLNYDYGEEDETKSTEEEEISSTKESGLLLCSPCLDKAHTPVVLKKMLPSLYINSDEVELCVCGKPHDGAQYNHILSEEEMDLIMNKYCGCQGKACLGGKKIVDLEKANDIRIATYEIRKGINQVDWRTRANLVRDALYYRSSKVEYDQKEHKKKVDQIRIVSNSLQKIY